jgi:hypothetical protein
MKLSLSLAVLLLSTAFSFAQTPSPTPALTEKEFEESIKKAFEERDRLLSKPQVIYLSPVINSSADEIAYVKRTLEYRLKGGGIIPFLGSSPEVAWISDKVQVVRRSLPTGTETVVFEMDLPDPHSDANIAGVSARLAWDNKLVYNIGLYGYELAQIPGAYYCWLSTLCIGRPPLDKSGSTTARGITVGLDSEMGSARYPISNKIVIACDDKVVSCPKF